MQQGNTVRFYLNYLMMITSKKNNELAGFYDQGIYNYIQMKKASYNNFKNKPLLSNLLL